MKKAIYTWKKISNEEEALYLNDQFLFKLYLYLDKPSAIQDKEERQAVERNNKKWFICSTSPSFHLIEKDYLDQIHQGFEHIETARTLCTDALNKFANQILELS